MGNTGLNKFDWIGVGLGIANIVVGLATIIVGTKANQVRMNDYQQQMTNIRPPQAA